MDCAFSEFSYGYAVTEELVGRLGAQSLGPPVFPTQRKEARLGYDMRLGPVFLQFKRPDVMVRPRRDSPELRSPINFEPPFFRMHLRKDNDWAQHRALRLLERQFRLVRYAAPRFRTLEDLARFYHGGTIVEHSALVHPRDVQLPKDSGAHYVAYPTTGRVAFSFSEPRKLAHAIDGESFLTGLEETAVTQGKSRHLALEDEFFVDLLNTVWRTLTRSLPIAAQEEADVLGALEMREMPAPYKVGYLSRLYLDSEALLL